MNVATKLDCFLSRLREPSPNVSELGLEPTLKWSLFLNCKKAVVEMSLMVHK